MIRDLSETYFEVTAKIEEREKQLEWEMQELAEQRTEYLFYLKLYKSHYEDDNLELAKQYADALKKMARNSIQLPKEITEEQVEKDIAKIEILADKDM